MTGPVKNRHAWVSITREPESLRGVFFLAKITGFV
jgi:hypothetical protein